MEQITTVHNVKQTLLRCFPCLTRVFAKTLRETLGTHPLLCVKTTEGLGSQGLNSVESWFRSGTEFFHPVYTYHEVSAGPSQPVLQVYRKEMEQTTFFLPSRIVRRGLVLARRTAGNLSKHIIEPFSGAASTTARSPGSRPDYSPGWRGQVCARAPLLED